MQHLGSSSVVSADIIIDKCVWVCVCVEDTAGGGAGLSWGRLRVHQVHWGLQFSSNRKCTSLLPPWRRSVSWPSSAHSAGSMFPFIQLSGSLSFVSPWSHFSCALVLLQLLFFSSGVTDFEPPYPSFFPDIISCSHHFLWLMLWNFKWTEEKHALKAVNKAAGRSVPRLSWIILLKLILSFIWKVYF